MQQRSAVKVGHTSRGISGALNLQSATAGVDPVFEGRSPPNIEFCYLC